MRSRLSSNSVVRSRLAAIADSATRDDGFTLVELVITMALIVIVMALLVPILETASKTAATSEELATASGQARLAIANLQSQVGSASQVCLPTQLTTSTAGPMATSGFAVRVSQLLSPSTQRWEQWMLQANGNLQEETFTPGSPASWVTVASGITNPSSTVPFSLPTAAQGSPQQLLIDLRVSESQDHLTQTVTVTSSAPAYDTPYTLAPTPLCSALTTAPSS